MDYKFPLPLQKPTQEDMHDRDSDGDFNPYDRVDEMGPTGYLIPRIVVSMLKVQCTVTMITED